jgi:hypothetical protein
MSVFKEQLLEYLELNDIKFVDKDYKVLTQCLSPEHEDNNMSSFIKLDEGNEFFHCSSCKFHMNSEQLHSLLNLGFDPNLAFKSQIERLLKLPDNQEETTHQVFLPIKEKVFNTKYRGISPETYQKVDAFSTFKGAYYEKRIIIPIKDVDSELRTFEAISTNKALVPKVLRPKNLVTSDIFGFEEFLGNSDTVFICEGIFNALSFMELGYQGAFNFGVSNIKNKIKKLTAKGIKNVILVGDNDTAGKAWNLECYHLLKKNFTVCFFQFPFNFKDKGDVNDLLKNEREALQECIDKTLEKNMIKIKIKEVKKDDN